MKKKVGKHPRPLKKTLMVSLLFIVGFILSCDSSNPPDVSGDPDQQNQLIHPDFNITRTDLEKILLEISQTDSRALLPMIEENILRSPQVFLSLVHQLIHFPQETFLLADKEHSLGPDYIPEDLVNLEQYQSLRTGHPFLILNRSEMQLRSEIIPDLLAMVEAARQDDIILDLSSTYRSYRYQDGLFAVWTERLGLEEAERVSARAGTSQHQLGTTIDFGSITPDFADHPAGRWLAQNAWKFGFSMSYPSGMEWLTGYVFEPWHYRWIGRPASRMEQVYFQGSQFRTLLFWNYAYPRFASAFLQ